MIRREMLHALGAAALLCTAGFAYADTDFPSKPVRIIVPYAPGGGPDILTRQLAQKLQDQLQGTVFVENKVGAGGMLAGEVAAMAPADGYTVLLGSSTHITQKVIQPKLKFDPIKSFEHITLTSKSSAVLVVATDSPFRDAKGLVEAMRREPGKLNYGSGGIGSAAHLAGAALLTTTGTSAVHVPYKGSVEIVPSILSGQTQFGFPVASTAVPLLRQGKVRALAVTSPTRLPQLPDVPTLKEVFQTDALVHESWSGMWVPAGTPKPVVDKLHAAFVAALNDAQVRKVYATAGTAVATNASPAEYRAFMTAEMDKFKKIVNESGITVD